MSTTTNNPAYPCIFAVGPVVDNSGNPTGKLDIDLVFSTGDRPYVRQVSVDGKNWFSTNTLGPNTTWYGDLLVGTGVFQQAIYRFIPQ